VLKIVVFFHNYGTTWVSTSAFMGSIRGTWMEAEVREGWEFLLLYSSYLLFKMGLMWVGKGEDELLVAAGAAAAADGAVVG
jgi:hypothetical protein